MYANINLFYPAPKTTRGSIHHLTEIEMVRDLWYNYTKDKYKIQHENHL